MLEPPAPFNPFRSVRLAIGLFTLMALVPLVFIGFRVFEATRNIVYWDEFDTVLDLLLQLDAGMNVRDFFERIFAINNEHRMLTSRLIFVTIWWLTGMVDFRIIGAIGNLFLVGFCLALVYNAGTAERRVGLGVLLGALMFQLGHFENLLWSGASIDHYQVVALAVGAFILLARGTAGALAGAALLAVLATFTLAHGLLTWPVGAVLLSRQRRWTALVTWSITAALAALAFFHSFEINSGHPIASFDVAGLTHIATYFLALIGAPLALGFVPAAIVGALLLLTALWVGYRGGWRKEPVILAVALFAVGALGMIALGRSEVAGGQLQSRYMVLSALAWAMVLFAALQRERNPARPFRLLAAAVPVLIVFNVGSNVHFAPAVESFVEGRDGAALRYKQYGTDGRDPFRLYPTTERANRILEDAAKRGLYWLPRMCLREEFVSPEPSGRIAYFVDEMTADTRAIYLSGWAAIPKEVSQRGEIYLVFKSADSSIIYSTVSVSRPDVAAASANPDWRLSGFRFAISRWRLPAEELQVGILIKHDDGAEFIMTEHRLRPFGRGEALLANSQ
jgi:hypothetical protein